MSFIRLCMSFIRLCRGDQEKQRNKRIQNFGWGGKPQISCNDAIRYFRKRDFLWDKDIAD